MPYCVFVTVMSVLVNPVFLDEAEFLATTQRSMFEDERVLPGSQTAIAEAVKLSKSIALCNNFEAGKSIIHKNLSEKIIGSASFDVIEPLKNDMKGTIKKISFKCVRVGPTIYEDVPYSDVNYVVFFSQRGEKNEILKIEKGTDKVVEEVKKLIISHP